MFEINTEDLSISATRGDTGAFLVSAKTLDGEIRPFEAGDVIRFMVFEKKACENVVLSKDFGVEEKCNAVEIYLDEKDTKKPRHTSGLSN